MRYTVPLLAALAFCLGTQSAVSAETTIMGDTPQSIVLRARERVAEGHLNKAIRLLSRFVSADPTAIDPERLLGDLYYREGNFKMAQTEYQRILEYAPNDKETHNRLGSVYASENRIDDAIREFNKSLPGADSVPNLVELHMRKGDFAQYEARHKARAIAYSNDAEAQLELGEIYETTNRPNHAILYLNRALQDSPGSQPALDYLGLAYLDAGRNQAAIKEFDACLKRNSFDYGCVNNLGTAYISTGQYALAQQEFETAHNLQPEGGEALVNLGYLADLHGDWKKAVAYYVTSMTVYPYAAEPYLDLGDDYIEHGLYDLAKAALVKGLAVAPDDGRLHYLLGEAYAHEGNNALATAQFNDAVRLGDPGVRAMAEQRVAALQSKHP